MGTRTRSKSSADLNDNIVTSAKIVDGTIVNADINDLAASKLTGALPAIDGSNLTGVQGSIITTEGNTFANYNSINSTTATVLASGKNYALFGTITVTSPYVWTVTGEPLVFI